MLGPFKASWSESADFLRGPVSDPGCSYLCTRELYRYAAARTQAEPSSPPDPLGLQQVLRRCCAAHLSGIPNPHSGDMFPAQAPSIPPWEPSGRLVEAAGPTADMYCCVVARVESFLPPFRSGEGDNADTRHGHTCGILQARGLG